MTIQSQTKLTSEGTYCPIGDILHGPAIVFVPSTVLSSLNPTISKGQSYLIEPSPTVFVHRLKKNCRWLG